jgi:ferric-dicitrate binding protein FerR (iron transport regulator)
MEKNFEFENMLLRLMEGEQLSDEQLKTLKDWLNRNPERKTELQPLTVIWTQLDAIREINEEEINAQWDKMQALTLNSKAIQRKSKLMSWSKYAAVFILGLLIASTIYYSNYSEKTQAYLSQVIEVPYGAKSTVKLADGSEVILNAGSQLSYTNDFGKRSRNVTLSGEAYFKVAKNPEKPFVVNTGDMIIRAYGTEFNVKSYTDENTTATTLVEGSISVELPNQNYKKNKEFFLKPDQQLILEKKTNTTKTKELVKNNSTNSLKIAKNIETEVFTSWVNDKIIVESETLDKLIIKLERKYNVRIHLDNEELKDLKYTGTLENETIEQIMHVLELSSAIDFRIDERQIWLSKNNKIKNK